MVILCTSRAMRGDVPAKPPNRGKDLSMACQCCPLLPALFVAGLLSSAPAEAPEYLTSTALEESLRSAVAKNPAHFELRELIRDHVDRPVWMVRVGPGGADSPAVLMVAGLDGRHLIGTELLVRFLTGLAKDEEQATKTLQDRTLFIIPRMNMDGIDAYYGTPRQERGTILMPGDADKDRRVDEDLADDLNGDGLITEMIVRHPKGTLVREGNFLRAVDPEKGEMGEWESLPEGRDNDGDGLINEEADNGVSLSRQFPVGYPWFASDAGTHTLSNSTARALADFLIETPQIAAVIVLGPEDNVLSPPPTDKAESFDADGSRGGRSPIRSMHKDDAALLSRIAKTYRENLGLKGTVSVPGSAEATKGGFPAFAHFARGRLALAVPVWTPESQLELLAKAEWKAEGVDAVHENSRNDFRFHAWMEETAPGSFKPWKEFDHPDFPDAEVHLGGFAPFTRSNPPAAMIDSMETTTTLLLTSVIESLPSVKLTDGKLTAKGRGVYELEFHVTNEGTMPDVLAMGRYSRTVRPTRIEVDPGTGGEVLREPAMRQLKRIPGNSRSEPQRFLLRPGGKSVTVRLISEMAGHDELTLEVPR